MIFMGLVNLSGPSGEGFLVESTRHLARRRGRTSGHGLYRDLKWLLCFYVRNVGLVGAGVSLQTATKTMIKDATASSATCVAEPAWRTLKLFFAALNSALRFSIACLRRAEKI